MFDIECYKHMFSWYFRPSIISSSNLPKEQRCSSTKLLMSQIFVKTDEVLALSFVYEKKKFV